MMELSRTVIFNDLTSLKLSALRFDQVDRYSALTSVNKWSSLDDRRASVSGDSVDKNCKKN